MSASPVPTTAGWHGTGGRMCGWRATEAALVACLALGSPLRAGSQTTTERARRYTSWLLDANVDSLWPVLSPGMRELANGRDGLVAFAKSIQEDAGRPTAVLTEFVVPVGPYQQYTERAQFDRAATVMVIQWSLDSNGTVAGALVRPEQPPAPSAYLDYRTKTPLRLPFDGRWLVAWGGRSTTENQHAIAADQRYAYDLLVLDGDRTRSEEHTSELQSHVNLVCRLLLEKKKKNIIITYFDKKKKK